jgi:hypothetical protein
MTTTFTIIETTNHAGPLNHNAGRWVAGRIGEYTYQAKVYPCGSLFGIRDGNISKLSIRDTATRKEIAAYDRGWDIHPVSELVTEMVDALVDHYHAE